MKNDIIENNHPDWLNKCSRYNTAICSKLHGTLFDDCIRNDRTDICNIMRYIPANDKYAGIGGGRYIHMDETTAALQSLCATLKNSIFGLNSFITTMKLYKNRSWGYENFVQKNSNHDIQTT